jgi:hypothetical protein
MKNFKQWLLSQEKRLGAVGDLARDLQWDYKDHKPEEEPCLGG